MVILIGGGKRPKTDVTFEFISSLKKDLRVLYVPFARYDLTGCMDFIQAELSGISIDRIVIPEIKEHYCKDDFDYYDMMYIGGGDVFRLQTFITTTGFSDVISHWIKKDKIVIGSSAGAIVLGKDVRMYRRIPNTLKKIDFKGINCIDGWSITCHYIEKGFYKQYSAESIKYEIENYCNSTKSKVIAIPEDGSVLIDKNEKPTILCGRIKTFGGILS